MRHLTQDESAVVLSRGRAPEVIHGPGSVRTFYRWRRVVIVSLAPFLVDASEIDVVTGDGATVRIRGNAAAQFFDPAAAATRVEDYRRATRIMFQTAIRSVVKKSPSAELPDDFSELEAEIKRILARALGDWGMSVA